MHSSMMHFFILAYPLLLSAQQLTIKAETVTTQEAVIGVADDPELLEPIEKEADPSSPEFVANRSEAYGVRQLIDDCQEKEQTLQLFKDESFVNAREGCQNRDELCTFWAAIGECESNENFMTLNCAPACYSCDKLDFPHIQLDKNAQEAIDRSESYGIRQDLGEEEEKEEQVLQRLLEIDEYMHEMVSHQDESFRRVNKHCHNRYYLCTYWAATGLCEENPTFMIQQCAPACYKCPLSEEAAALISLEDQIHENWEETSYTFREYYVAGRNLATYRLKNVASDDKDEPPYELFEDFNIGHLIRGDECWETLRKYRDLAEHLSHQFYGDKVARKRWLPKHGFNQVKQYFGAYFDEICPGEDDDMCMNKIFKHLPNKTGFIAKPSHMGDSQGVNLVTYDEVNDVNQFQIITPGLEMLKKNYTMRDVAENLVTYRNKRQEMYHIVHFHNLKPGIIVEEMFTHPDDYNMPPTEMQIFVIWGRVFCGIYFDFQTLDDDEKAQRYGYSTVYRDGSAAYQHERSLPDYVDWPRMVQLAEKLGANKDLIRIDIFVGLPASFPKNATKQERRAAVQYACNEDTVNPSTLLGDGLEPEATRLWIAGYKIGNYKVVPNTEVPREYLDTGGYYYMSNE